MPNQTTYSLDADILSRVIDPSGPELSLAAARSLASLGFPEPDVTKMNSLAAKARSGEITADENAELDSYLRVGRLLALLQAKARQSLQRFTGGAA
jgi:hypothetical protein